MSSKDDKPPTSKEEADARRVRRPAPEKYDPDKLSRWSITMMVAWILWRKIDAVRNERDDYRNECADKPSGWNRLRLAARLKNLPPQVAIDELWLEAGEGRIKATAIECKNAKTFDGDRIEIPAHYWARLKPADDRLTGKAMLSDDQGRVYRDVEFSRLDAKKRWPESPPLSGEPLDHAEKPEPEQARPAEPELLKPAAWFDDARKNNQRHKNEPLATYAGRLHDLMQKAHASKHVTKLWTLETLLRRLHDK